MAERKAVTKKKIEPGEVAVIESRKRKTDVLAQNAVDKSLKPPKWVKPSNHAAYMNLVELCASSEFNNISEFARKWQVTRDTIYAWLKSNDTKNLVDEVIKTLAAADKGKVYEMILSQVPVNASYARLWMERYEGYRPDVPAQGNVIINFNFDLGDNKPVIVAEDAEFEE